MSRSLLVGLLFACFAAVAAQASDLVLMHARVYPSPDAVALQDATVLMHDGRIASVSSSNPIAAPRLPPGAQVIDATGMSVTAGLWNCHVHILPVKLLHADGKSSAQLTAALQEMLTGWGFTSVFDVASILANTNNIRSRIATGQILGPRILTTGEPFFPRDGVPSYVKGYLDENHITLPDDPSTAAAVQRVRREVHEGADGIKIFAGSIEGRDVLLMPLERAQAIVTEAHRLHRPVFAHPSNLAGIELALDSRVDVLAHVTSDDEGWSAELLERMRAAHMALIPTLSLFDVEATNGGASVEQAQKIVDRAVARLRAYASAGGEILFGTDVGYIYQFDTAEEYALMASAGMSFSQILASLTTSPARRFGVAGHSGRIARNMDADLTVFMGDPGRNVTALSHVRYTIRAGRIIFQALPAPDRS
jgi:imidazolonepropionase-like amidohydrolase